MARSKVLSLTGACVAAAAIFVSGAALSQGATEPGVQGERQQITGFIQLLKSERQEENHARQRLNETNSTFIESMRRDISANEAKRVQTLINQTQDAINQQSNAMTSLIEELRNINSSISRS